MTVVYLIRNNEYLRNDLLNNINDKLNHDNDDKNVLTVKGEKLVSNIANCRELKNIDMVFTSDCVRNIGIVKYFIKEDGQININDSFNEINWKRKDNEIEKKILRDFDFKEYGCESVNDVRKRMAEALKTILFHYQDDRILIASHKIAIISLLSIWCEIGYNYENDLIMSYENQTIIDGVWEDLVIFKLEFEGKDLINLKRLYL